MTAGTAQKIALNLFSTQLMMELGRVYQGLMVNVVPANAKLVARSHRIVQAIAGCDLDRGGRGLGARRPGHQARRPAARRARSGDAAARLREARGDLRRARPIHDHASLTSHPREDS